MKHVRAVVESFKCHRSSAFTPLFILACGGRCCLCISEEGLNSVRARPPENSVKNLFRLYLYVFQTDFIEKMFWYMMEWICISSLEVY